MSYFPSFCLLFFLLHHWNLRDHKVEIWVEVGREGEKMKKENCEVLYHMLEMRLHEPSLQGGVGYLERLPLGLESTREK